MTAGNLFCGFTRHSEDFGRRAAAERRMRMRPAIFFTRRSGSFLAPVVFDLLDGRLARLGGHESAFGREFDSLADIVSFGVAPALMVYRIVLQEFPQRMLDHRLRLSCCAARCVWRASIASRQRSSDRTAERTRILPAFPIPAAAGLIASITLFHALAGGRRASARQMEIRSAAADDFSFVHDVQPVSYPSFKAINWRTKKSIPRFLVIILVLVFTVTELRMDAGGPVSRLFALRISSPVALARMAARNRGRNRRRRSRRPSAERSQRRLEAARGRAFPVSFSAE